MATKIVTKSGSGAPATTDLVAGELAVDLTNKRLYTENDSAAIIELGTNPSGDITFGDNGKAIFGAGSDLQIYHDGSHSYIEDAGTGNLRIDAQSFQVRKQGTTENIAGFAADGAVSLYYDNALKLATSATGIDVTGTVTADGLVVENTAGATLNINTALQAADSKILLHEGTTASPSNGASIRYDGAANLFKIGVGASVDTTRLSIDRNTGDISFYEDTGTTPKFFWDASAEALGIGTSTPLTSLWLQDSAAQKATFANADFVANSAGSTFDISMGATTGSTYTSLRALTTGRNAWGNLVLQEGGGNVGIGLTPSEQLHLGGRADVVLDLQSNATTGTGRINFSDTTVRGQIIYTHTDDSMGFLTAATERMRIDASGNVGIGVVPKTGGSTWQHVQFGGTGNLIARKDDSISDAMFSNNYYVNASNADSYITTGAAARMFMNDNVISFDQAASGSTDAAITWSEAMRIDSSGNVGIGVVPTNLYAGFDTISLGTVGGSLIASTPSYSGSPYLWLGNNIYADASAVMKAETTSASAYYRQLNNTHTWSVDASGAADRVLTTTPSMTLDGSGNLLVGTTSTDVTAGAFAFQGTGATNSVLKNGHKTGSASGADFMACYYAGAQIGGVAQSGTTGVSFNTSSDQRLKENIADADDAGSKIDAIQVRKFDWKVDGSHQDYGMVAQELLEVAPEAVSAPEDPEDMMGVDYSKLVPMMLKEIQSLRARINALEAE